MRITAIETYLLTVPQQACEWREGIPGMAPTSESLWIRVVTDEGVDGWSNLEFWGTVGLDLIDRRLRDIYVGRDPLMKEDLWQRVWEIDRIEELPDLCARRGRHGPVGHHRQGGGAAALPGARRLPRPDRLPTRAR